MNIIEELLDTIADENNTQKDVAEAYHAALGKISYRGWREVNLAITKRWPSKSGLTRVKTKAWRIYEERQNEHTTCVEIAKD